MHVRWIERETELPTRQLDGSRDLDRNDKRGRARVWRRCRDVVRRIDEDDRVSRRPIRDECRRRRDRKRTEPMSREFLQPLAFLVSKELIHLLGMVGA